MKGVHEMTEVSAGDLLFILLVGVLIGGILLLAKQVRRVKKEKDTSPPS
jgi:hypothetical protein